MQARRYRALAVNLSDDKVTVVMSDPADLSALDAIAALLSPRSWCWPWPVKASCWSISTASIAAPGR